MSNVESILCNNCKEQMIVDTMYPHRYGFELKAIDVNRNSSDSTFCVMIHPPIEEDHHFCNTRCLVEWGTKRLGGGR